MVVEAVETAALFLAEGVILSTSEALAEFLLIRITKGSRGHGPGFETS